MKCCDLIGAATIVAARSSEVCVSHQTHCLHNETVVYRTQENFGRRKSANLANCEPFTKFSLPIALPTWFTKIFPYQIFPMYDTYVHVVRIVTMCMCVLARRERHMVVRCWTCGMVKRYKTTPAGYTLWCDRSENIATAQDQQQQTSNDQLTKDKANITHQ